MILDFLNTVLSIFVMSFLDAGCTRKCIWLVRHFMSPVAKVYCRLLGDSITCNSNTVLLSAIRLVKCQ